MIKKTLILFFLICTSFQFKLADQSNSNTKHDKSFSSKTRVLKKRDNCDSSAKAMVAQNSINTFLSVIQLNNPLEVFSLFSNIAGLTGSIFGLNSDSTCEIHRKVDKILTEVIRISGDVKKIQQGIDGFIIRKSYHDLSGKMETFLNLLKEHAVTPYKNETKNDLKKNCLDTNSGINKIYSDFKILMKSENVIDYLKNVARYESKKIDHWIRQTTVFAFDLALIVKGCEEALNQLTNINLKEFFDTTVNNVLFFKDFIVEHFAKNSEPSGIRESIKIIANKGKNAKETANLLKDHYSFFDWTVIFYSDKVHKKEHTSFTWNAIENDEKVTPYSGSFHFISELKDRNALIAWSPMIEPSNMSNYRWIYSVLLKSAGFKSNKISMQLRNTEAYFWAERIKDNLKGNEGNFLNFVLAIGSSVTSSNVDSYCPEYPCLDLGKNRFQRGDLRYNMHCFFQMRRPKMNPRKILEYKTYSIIFRNNIKI
ncbi:unnamed protein product [Brachionus calyciflorus]|uniref:Uncharacterized protein n=1 Tax=Brachionus calyciflorus TaxID=104777 RepID=A0A813M6W5_9BILA|nr:unnamed protein product [Brachionus calyciflorus]